MIHADRFYHRSFGLIIVKIFRNLEFSGKFLEFRQKILEFGGGKGVGLYLKKLAFC